MYIESGGISSFAPPSFWFVQLHKMGPLSRTFLILSVFALVKFHINARGENEAVDQAFVENDAEQIENEYDEDELDGMDYGVEEIIFESPADIDALTNTALKEFALALRKDEGLKGPGGYGTVCSKDEHCEDREKCSKNGRCRPKNSTIPDSCRYGISTCVHAEGSPIRALADKVIKERSAVQPKILGAVLHAALLPAPAQNLLSLPPPAQLRLANDTSDLDGELQAAQTGGQTELSRSMEAYVESVALVDEISKGALTGAGALPSDTKKWLDFASRGKERVMRRPFRNFWDPQDRTYRIAQNQGEKRAMINASKLLEKRRFPNSNDQELMEWFEKNGGKMTYLRPDGRSDGTRKLVAEEAVGEEDYVLEVPFQITMNQMSVRNIKVGHTGRYLDEYIGGLFGKNQEWGLAAFLLFEISKGNRSHWWPMIRTLNMHVMTTSVIKELEGTYVANRIRRWEEEAEDMHKFFEKVVGQKDHMGEVSGTWATRKQLRWALWVARRHSIEVRKVTTGKVFKAFVPFANYLKHKRGCGGKSEYALDNTIRIRVSDHDAGSEVCMQHGEFSDIETMIRHHTVDETSLNPNNQIIVGLPGARGPDGDDIFWEWTNMKEWRRAMKLPPKQSDLWRLADKLHLYGEEWDEEEQKKIAGRNINLKGLPLPLEQASVEEQLMLLGYAKTEEEAALMAYGKDAKKLGEKPELYTALDPEEDERAMKASEEMSDAMMQLQEAVAAAHTDEAVLKVINQTRDFFLYGIQPVRGLDEVDKLMTRKRTLVEQCGNMTEHYVFHNGVSDYLMCALRVHVMNQSDVETVCPMQDGAFWAEEKKCEGGGFNWTVPISMENENTTISSLVSTMTALQKEYKSTIEEDESLLELSTLPKLMRAAIVVRKREKELIQSVINYLEKRRSQLVNLTYQIEGVRASERIRKKRMKELAEFKQTARKKAFKKVLVVRFEVNLGKKGKQNFTVFEGEDLEKVAKKFGDDFGLKAKVLPKILASARKRIRQQPKLQFFTPIVLDNGTRVTLRMLHGENLTTVTRSMGAIYNLTDEQTRVILPQVLDKYDRRMKKKTLVSFPVTVPDGRTITIEVREGEEHDLMMHMTDMAHAMNMDVNIEQLANLAFQRLKPIALQIPIEVAGRTRSVFHFRNGDSVEASALAFCEYHGHTKEIYEQIIQNVYQQARRL